MAVVAQTTTPTFHPENCRLNLELYVYAESRIDGSRLPFCIEESCGDSRDAKDTFERCLQRRVIVSRGASGGLSLGVVYSLISFIS
jgi:hypothetical protein